MQILPTLVSIGLFSTYHRKASFFLPLLKRIIMENMRRGDGRKGQPHNNNTSIKRDQAPFGFEGMNFEQKRKPYGEGINGVKTRNWNPGSDTNLGKRRD